MTSRCRFAWLLIAFIIAPVEPLFAKGLPPEATSVKPAPAFTLPTREGFVSLDSLRGKAVFVDFWASWCDPCRKSFPWLSRVHDRYAAKGFVIVAINLDRDRRAAETFLKKYPAPFIVAFDPAGKTAKAFGVWGMPSSFLISPTDTILYSFSGFDPNRAATIESLIEKACPR